MRAIRKWKLSIAEVSRTVRITVGDQNLQIKTEKIKTKPSNHSSIINADVWIEMHGDISIWMLAVIGVILNAGARAQWL